ncbi:MAG: acyltransferase family protein [Deltaproteobacteria bacterium]|nr:acyltransferase family protein [Deltaproteobacteria bacterium]MBW2384048.1 acyltransferase family protein [Deltaproteobacteria bacterium]MBW2698694.1 acyltransferase family protein [Deltaproteobacteria bacterium]
MHRLQDEIAARVANVPSRLNEYGFDPVGLSPDWVIRTYLPAALMYRYYFRAEVVQIENVPSGPVLLVGNHAGQLPFDGMMLGAAMLLEAEPPRIVRGMAEYFVSELPWVSVAAARSGSLVGTPLNCVAMLEAGECVMVFPEGVRGMNKLYRDRYQLQRFGLGFMRLALETNTPIVPVSIVGSEEQQPGLANFERVGRLFGLPALPITPTFPLLGPLGLLPLPVKYRIYFGEPLHFEGDPSDDDARIEEQVDVVRAAIARGFERGLSERRGIFSG